MLRRQENPAVDGLTSRVRLRRRLLLRRWRGGDAHGAEVRFGVGANVGEAGGIGHVRGLAGFGVGPALALLEFHGMIVEQLIDGHRWQHQGVQGVFRVP